MVTEPRVYGRGWPGAATWDAEPSPPEFEPDQLASDLEVVDRWIHAAESGGSNSLFYPLMVWARTPG